LALGRARGEWTSLAALPESYATAWALLNHNREVRAGELRAAPAHEFELEQIVAAHQLMESGEALGKIVVRGP
jgi:NADPH:quinone reductase-like Zn-dependent oxidoreductase